MAVGFREALSNGGYVTLCYVIDPREEKFVLIRFENDKAEKTEVILSMEAANTLGWMLTSGGAQIVEVDPESWEHVGRHQESDAA